MFIFGGTNINCFVTDGEPLSCYGAEDGQATAIGSSGVEPYEYEWSNGEVTQTAVNLGPGIHTVIVTDGRGCAGMCEVEMPDLPEFSCTININSEVSCMGESDASATVVSTGGAEPFEYDWENGEAGQTANSLPAGVQAVTITDANGCTSSCTIIISEPELLSCEIEVVSNACYMTEDGVLTVNGNGGTEPYEYEWSNGATSETVTGLEAGVYSVTITDANGCVTDCEATISEAALFTCSIVVNSDILCVGDDSAIATVMLVGGVEPFSYSWSSGETEQTASNLTSGFQTVVVTDANGCESTCNIFISEPTELACTISLDSAITCVGDEDGSATVTPEGGTAPYTYLWQNGETTQTAIGLAVGSNSVMVTDDNGCQTSCQIVLTDPEIFACETMVILDADCIDGSNGSAEVMPLGGTGPYT